MPEVAVEPFSFRLCCDLFPFFGKLRALGNGDEDKAKYPKYNRATIINNLLGPFMCPMCICKKEKNRRTNYAKSNCLKNSYESSVNSDQTAVFTLLFQNVVANNQILRISTHMHSSLGTTVIFDCFTHL